MMQAAFYGRVSNQEQIDGYSIDAQLRARDMFAYQRGWVSIETYLDEGHSAFRESLNRPALQRLLDDVRAGRVQTVFVHKLDRFSRRASITFDLIEEFGRLGVSFVSIAESIDLTTPFGWAAFQMQGVYAELYSRNLSFEVKKGLLEKARQGRWVGTVPLGYDRDAGGILLPNSDAAIIRLVFELYATGLYSVSDVAAELNQRGFRSKHGALFARTSVNNILQRRVYLGVVQCAGQEYPGAHEPLVSQELWDSVQRIIAQRASWRGVTVQRQDALLSGCCWCAACGGKMHVQKPRKERLYYQCYGRRQQTCAERNVPGEAAEQRLLAWLACLQVPAQTLDMAVAEAQRLLAVQQEATPPRIDRQALAQRERRLARLYADGLIDDAAYDTERAAMAQLREAAAPLTQTVLHIDRAREILATLPQQLALGSPATQRACIQVLFDRIYMRDRRIVAVAPRADVEPIVRSLAAWSIAAETSVSGAIDHIAIWLPADFLKQAA